MPFSIALISPLTQNCKTGYLGYKN